MEGFNSHQNNFDGCGQAEKVPDMRPEDIRLRSQEADTEDGVAQAVEECEVGLWNK
jgi:hypothetical protein